MSKAIVFLFIVLFSFNLFGIPPTNSQPQKKDLLVPDGFIENKNNIILLPIINKLDINNFDWLTTAIEDKLNNDIKLFKRLNLITIYNSSKLYDNFKNWENNYKELSNKFNAKIFYGISLIPFKEKIILNLKLFNPETMVIEEEKEYISGKETLIITLPNITLDILSYFKIKPLPFQTTNILKPITTSLNAYINYINALISLNKKDYKKAILLLQMASDSDPNFQEADYLLGTTYYTYKQIDNGIKTFTNMLKEGKIRYNNEIEKHLITTKDKSLEVLLKLAENDDIGTVYACKILRNYKIKKVLNLLIKKLDSEKYSVLRSAANSLIFINDSSIIDVLLDKLNNNTIKNYYRRFWLTKILENYKDGKIVKIFEKNLLNDPSGLVRKVNAIGLAKIGSKDNADALIKALNDNDPGVLIAVIQSLGILKADSSIDALIKLYKKDTRSFIRNEIINALLKIDKDNEHVRKLLEK